MSKEKFNIIMKTFSYTCIFKAECTCYVLLDSSHINMYM